jgi:ComF family protein
MSKITLKEHIVNAFFPKRCKLCGKVINPHYDLCCDCENGDFYIKGEICELCGVEKEYCVCKKHKNSFCAVVSPFYYEGGAKAAVLKLKFGEHRQYAKSLAEYMASCVNERFEGVEFDEIAFVPMTKSQIRERSFNQSELLAIELGKALGKPVVKYLIKEFETKQQHTLKESLRKGNVLGAFAVDGEIPFSPEGKTVLLCDDILTTGATMNECAKMLRLSGAKDVYCVAAAITKKRVDKTD